MKPTSYYLLIDSPAPDRRHYNRVFAYSEGVCFFNGGNENDWVTAYSARYARTGHTYRAPVVERVFDEEAYAAAVRQHSDLVAVRTGEFIADLAAEAGIHSNPRHPEVYAQAEQYANRENVTSALRLHAIAEHYYRFAALLK